MPNAEYQFKSGDVVRLKSGGFDFVISKIINNKIASVIYFTDHLTYVLDYPLSFEPIILELVKEYIEPTEEIKPGDIVQLTSSTSPSLTVRSITSDGAYLVYTKDGQFINVQIPLYALERVVYTDISQLYSSFG